MFPKISQPLRGVEGRSSVAPCAPNRLKPGRMQAVDKVSVKIMGANAITLIVGLALIVVGLLGGGIEVKEIKIPQLPMISRAASFLFGCILISLVLFYPQLFSPSEQKSTPGNRCEHGAA